MMLLRHNTNNYNLNKKGLFWYVVTGNLVHITWVKIIYIMIEADHSSKLLSPWHPENTAREHCQRGMVQVPCTVAQVTFA